MQSACKFAQSVLYFLQWGLLSMFRVAATQRIKGEKMHFAAGYRSLKQITSGRRAEGWGLVVPHIVNASAHVLAHVLIIMGLASIKRQIYWKGR